MSRKKGKILWMFHTGARHKIEQELIKGNIARQEGFEGRARVCARRAAGAAIREYLQIQDIPLPGPDAVDLLDWLAAAPGMSNEFRQVARHMLTRVGEDFTLPDNIDLLAEARWLAHELENQSMIDSGGKGNG